MLAIEFGIDYVDNECSNIWTLVERLYLYRDKISHILQERRFQAYNINMLAKQETPYIIL
jgi:hypothetical protein